MEKLQFLILAPPTLCEGEYSEPERSSNLQQAKRLLLMPYASYSLPCLLSLDIH
jgi:hypothetical protein